MGPETFSSKRGRIHLGLILATVLLVVAGFVQVVTMPNVGVLATAGWGLLLAAAAGGLLWALAWTRYHVVGGLLILRCGPFCCRVAIEDVEEVVRVRSLASSYALARERLRIVLADTGGCIDISPRDDAGFLRAVAAHRSDLILTDDGLVAAHARAGEA